MLAATVAHAVQVESGALPPDAFRGTALDMVQYTRIFSSCRLPHATCDTRHKAAAPSGHVVVLRGASMWSVPVVGAVTGLALSVPATLRTELALFRSFRPVDRTAPTDTRTAPHADQKIDSSTVACRCWSGSYSTWSTTPRPSRRRAVCRPWRF